MADQQTQLVSALLERGLLKPAQVQHVQERADKEGKTLWQIIQEENLVFPEALAELKADMSGFPYIDLTKAKINEHAMRDIARKAAGTYRFVAFDERDKKLLIAMENPEDFQSLEAVKFIAKRRGLTPEVYLASAAAIDTVLGGASAVAAEIGGALKDFNRELADVSAQSKQGAQEIERVIEEAPVTKVVAVVIRHAIEGHASDIHIEPTAKDLRIRYRINGKLHTSLLLPLKVHAAIISRVKILSNLKIDEARLPQDGRFSATVDAHSFDFRVSTMPTTFGEKVALRILDKSSGAPTFTELGVSKEGQELLKQNLEAPHGIILLSGPTGAGKSTTLFASLSTLNATDTNIVTLEDPVEYEIAGVNQTQVHPEIGLSFASGLRSILRQDPDIIMVGEIRDKETAELAVHASLTGHLVLSTIHTNDAVGTVPRLVDMGIDPFLLAASLRLLVAQRLVGRLCQQCKHEVPIPSALRQKILAVLETVPEKYKTEANQKNPKALYESPGCPACQESGVVGRIGIFEIIPINRALRTAINDSAEYNTLLDTATGQGFLTMQQDGLLKVLAGLAPYEDVARVTAEGEN